MPDEPKVPDNSGETTQETTTTPAVETKTESQTETPSIPEKFKGKTAEEISRDYVELERKLGEHSKTIEEKKALDKELQDWRQLGTYLQGNPALMKGLEEEIKSKTGTTTESKRDDQRIATEQIVIGSFEKNFGIDNLPTEKRQELYKKIGTELSEMLDPTGKKSYQQIIEDIPLDRLPKYLDKAYGLATINDKEERARLQGFVDAKQNSEGAFGSMPSSNGKTDSVTLTADQRRVAQKLGVSEEAYTKQLKKIEDGN